MAQQAITQKWLATQVGRYQEKNEVYEHVDAVLEAFPTLRPKADVYSKRSCACPSLAISDVSVKPTTMAE